MDDGRRAVHLGQVHDAEAVLPAGLGDHRHGGVDDDGAVAVRGVLVVRDGRARRADARAGHQLPQVAVQRLDDRGDGLRLVPRGGAGQLPHPDRREALDHHPVDRDAGLVLNGQQARLDPGQPGRLVLDVSVDLGPAQLQHAAQLGRADLFGQDGLHLAQGEAEVLQRDDAVQLGQLSGLVEAVSGRSVDGGRAEQADRVVVPQHADRHAAVPSELPDAEHDGPVVPPDTVSGSTRQAA